MKTVEEVIVKEELRHKEARTGVLLHLEMGDRSIEVIALDVVLGIRGAAHAKSRLDEGGDDVHGIAVVGGARARRHSLWHVTAQRQHIHDSRLMEFVDLGGQVGVAQGDARLMGAGREAQLVRQHGGNLRGGGVVGGAARRVRDAHKIRGEPGELFADFARTLQGELAFGREHLERDGQGAPGGGVSEQLIDSHSRS